MASPRIGKFSQSTTLTWSDGTLFNGFFLVGTAIPTLSGTAFGGVYYGNSGLSEPLPRFYVVPVSEGKYNEVCGLFYNADIAPPNSTYYGWLYTMNGPGGLKRQVAGPTTAFTVSSDSFTPPALTPTITVAASSAPDPDVSITPSTVVTTELLLTMESPAETPNGVTTAFTFTAAPQVVIYNGVWRFEGVGYTRSDLVVTLIDDSAIPFAPETGASIKAIL